jgi:hypothetical protein
MGLRQCAILGNTRAATDPRQLLALDGASANASRRKCGQSHWTAHGLLRPELDASKRRRQQVFSAGSVGS